MKFGEILLDEGLITPAQLEAALNTQRANGGTPRLGELLIEQGLLTPAQGLAVLARQFDMPCLPEVPPEALEAGLVAQLPVEWARGQRLLPIRWNGRLHVLTVDPAHWAAREDLELMLGCELPPVLTSEAELRRCLDQAYFAGEHSARALIDALETAPAEAGGAEREEGDLLGETGAAPAARLVNLLLLEAVKAGASDIHIEPFRKEVRVRFRVDGELAEQAAPPRSLADALVSRLKVMGRLDIAERRLPQDGMARVRVGEREIDVRISTVPVAAGERVVLRLLDRDSALLPLEALGLPERLARPWRELLEAPNGIIWVTGPTGSGKTTTLYAALQALETGRRNIMTIEDPVEYQLPGIGQMAVQPRIGLTFAQGLRHILRQDPDVILVGETRDLETAEIAVRASLTGHLVFSTLHTNDAVGAVVRLVDMGVPSYLLAAAARGFLAQRLVRRLCPACRTLAPLTPAERQRLGPAAELVGDAPVGRAGGCPACRDGYRGRIGLFELLRVDDALRETLRHATDLAVLRAAARQAGLVPLAEQGLELAKAGTTSLAEILRQVAADYTPPA
ncbi:MAG: Flp pilus assembly complex ATPase component TadA [Candidatus Marinimicrobia bacterium]|nr:Flp pilus assembly complex ATPase component TadA [Candidatus Neomarinimicrobiota bacterium]